MPSGKMLLDAWDLMAVKLIELPVSTDVSPGAMTYISSEEWVVKKEKNAMRCGACEKGDRMQSLLHQMYDAMQGQIRDYR